MTGIQKTRLSIIAFLLLIPFVGVLVLVAIMSATLGVANAHQPLAAPSLAQAVSAVSASKRDGLLVDNDNDGGADPGDTLAYTVTIQNQGTSVAEDVLFSDTLDGALALSGTVQSTPLALGDSYQALANMPIIISATNGVLAGTASAYGPDQDPDGGAVTAVSSSGATTQGGTVQLLATGAFTYTPPAGFIGEDTFTYAIIDDEGEQDQDTVTIQISGPRIWYVNNTAPAGGDGTFDSPFNRLAALNAAQGSTTGPATGDTIFIYEGGGPYDGGLTLLDGQILVGQGSDLLTVTGIVLPPGAPSLPAAGTAPLLTNSTTSYGGNGIVLASNNAIWGLGIGNTPTASAISDSGNSVGNLTVHAVTISGEGGAFAIDDGGTLDARVESIAVATTAAGVHALSFAGIDGTFSVTGTTTVNAQGMGLSVNNSSGATFSFGRTLAITTTGFDAIQANSAGTISLLASDNSVSATADSAIEVANTSLGTGWTFTQVSSSNSPDSGIFLDSAGSGGFTVTGSGSTAGSGGTLQNIGQRGVVISNTTNVSLSNMNLTNATTTESVATHSLTCTDEANGTNTGCNAPIYLLNASSVTVDNLVIDGSVQHGINGNNVNGLSIQNTTLQNIGQSALSPNSARENGLNFVNLLGTVAFNNLTLDGALTRNAIIENNTGSVNLTTANSTIQNAAGSDGFLFVASNSANATLNITGSRFVGNEQTAIEIQAMNNSNVDVTVQSNSVAGEVDTNGSSGLLLSAADNATVTFDVVGSAGSLQTFQEFNQAGIAVNTRDNARGSGTIGYNSVGNSKYGDGIQVHAAGTSTTVNQTMVVAIQNNTVSGIQGVGVSGIYLGVMENSVATGNTRLDATVTNNNVSFNGADAAIQVFLVDPNDHQSTACLDARNNVTSGSGGFGANQFFLGNDPDNLGNSGVAIMSGWNGNVDQTWFNVNSNSSPTAGAYADIIGVAPVAGTCNTVAATNITVAPALAAVPGARHQAPQPNPTLEPDRSVALTMSPSVEPARVSKRALNRAARPGASRGALVVPPPLRTSLSARAPAVDAITLNLGTLPPGKAVTITFQATIVEPFPVGLAEVSNQAQISGSNFSQVLSDDPDTATPADPTVTAVEVTHQLVLSKQVSANPAIPGRPLTYTLVYSNEGESILNTISLTDTLPPLLYDLAYSSNRPLTPTGTFSYSWQLASLDPGETGVITVTGVLTDQAPAGAVFTNTAVITSSLRESNAADNTAEVSTTVSALTRCDLRSDTYTFNLTLPITISVSERGTLDCLTVERHDNHHPNATVGIQTGRYWHISGVDARGNPASSFSLALTLPYAGTPDGEDKVCRYTGGGQVWDCALTSFAGSNLTRTGITQLSDWAVGNNVGPTAVVFGSSQARTAASPTWLVLALLLTVVTAGLLLRLSGPAQSAIERGPCPTGAQRHSAQRRGDS